VSPKKEFGAASITIVEVRIKDARGGEILEFISSTLFFKLASFSLGGNSIFALWILSRCCNYSYIFLASSFN
jgi:hypothetical protein